ELFGVRAAGEVLELDEDGEVGAGEGEAALATDVELDEVGEADGVDVAGDRLVAAARGVPEGADDVGARLARREAKAERGAPSRVLVGRGGGERVRLIVLE